MKKVMLVVNLVFVLSLIFLPVGQGFASSDTSALVEALVQKGVLTVDEANTITARVEKQQKNGKSFNSFWKDGIRFESADEDFKIQLGGRVMTDFAFYSASDKIEKVVGDLEDGAEFRRARLYLSGDIYDSVIFKAQYDFAGGDADFKDVYIGLKNVPFLNTVKVGHFKEPFGLEELTSSKYITFMERALPVVFTPSRNTGIGFHTPTTCPITGVEGSFAAGVFKDTDAFGDRQEDGQSSFSTRLTCAPIYENKGEKLLHLGAAYSYRNPPKDDLRYRERPESHMATRFVDTKAFSADDVNMVGTELAIVSGPLSLQSEYIHSFVDVPKASDPDFFGVYAYISYFLTGEHRKYKKASGTFSRVKPKNNFSFEDEGKGAWEVAARYSHLDLHDAGIKGGKLDDLTVGLNWYLNPNTRVMWNYVYADLDKVGDAHIFQTRFQIDF